MAYINNKEFYIKVFRPGLSGAFVDTIYDFTPSTSGFRKQINGGLGNYSFQIPKQFDNFGQNDLVAKNNQIQVWVVDVDSGPYGVLLYRGYIYSTEATINGTVETVMINCYGNVTKASKALLKYGQSVILNTTTSDLDATNPVASISLENCVKYVIDRYNGEYGSQAYFNYTSSSIVASGTSGVNMQYTFDKQMITDALNTCQSLAIPLTSSPFSASNTGQFFWYVDEQNVFWFQSQPSTPVHTFIFGEHFTQVDILDNADTVINNVVVQSSGSGTQILSTYNDSTSQTQYDPCWEVKTDNSILVQTDADALGKTELSTLKGSIIRTTVDIIDNNLDPVGYNIESIQPGQTCQFSGFNNITSQNFTNNMLIVSVDYYSDYATLTLEQLPEYASRQVADAQDTADTALGSNNIVNLTSVGVPPADTGLVVLGFQTGNWVDNDGRHYALLNGQNISRTTFANLFSFWGTTYGSGDGSTTFGIPNAVDYVPIMAGNMASVAQKIGSTTVNLSHSHTVANHNHALSDHQVGVGILNSGASNANQIFTYTSGSNNGVTAVGIGGGSDTGNRLNINTEYTQPGTDSQLSSSQSIVQESFGLNFFVKS